LPTGNIVGALYHKL